jgi:ADP-ribosylglycohydrolase
LWQKELKMASNIQDKIRGCFLGIGIGDGIGCPVETFSRGRIAAEYGRITRYLEPKGHKWFNGQPAGAITDDTQLSLAVAEAMIESPLNMDAQAKYHVEALKFGTKGWGRSTKDSVRRLANGCHWSKSGSESGVGNGVAMKVAPLGLYFLPIITRDRGAYDVEVNKFLSFVSDLSLMTHRTSMAVSSGLAMATAVLSCFARNPGQLNIDSSLAMVVQASKTGEQVLPETLGEDRLTERLKLLANHKEYDTDKMIAEFGGGSCYVYNSLPFALMHFYKNPETIDCLYDVISAGGDTDSNGSMVGALLGAYHGESIFPTELIEGLVDRQKVLEIADKFYEKFFEKE